MNHKKIEILGTYFLTKIQLQSEIQKMTKIISGLKLGTQSQWEHNLNGNTISGTALKRRAGLANVGGWLGHEACPPRRGEPW